MEGFLAGIAARLWRDHGTTMHRVGVVLPTRRAGLFLRQALGRVQADNGVATPFWLPPVLTLPGLLETLSGRQVPDRLSLLLLLYEEYHILLPDEPLERFLSWGEMILQDFEDADAARANTRQLFANLKDLKELEASLAFSAAELEAYRAFWASFSHQPLGQLQDRFLRLWAILGPLHQRYTQALAERGWAYPGLTARLVAEALASDTPPQLPVQHLLIAGLADLKPAEADVVDRLVNLGWATVLPDADAWYVDHIPQHEAGRWFRRHLSGAQRENLSARIGQQPLDVGYVGCPQQVAQAKFVAQWIDEKRASGARPQDMAIVLPDETLLFPVLYALPPDLPEVNVTMGYPMRWAPLHGLLHAVLDLNRRPRRDSSQRIVAYHQRPVRQVLLHTHVQAVARGQLHEFIANMDREQRVWLTPNMLPHHTSRHALSPELNDLLALLFAPVERADGLLQLFLDLIIALRSHLIAQDESHPVAVVELEVLFHFQTELQRLHDLLGSQLHLLSLEALWQLLTQLFTSGRIPFSGEPLKGLQVLGLGETRALDFPHVLVLSCNEGTLPTGKSTHSLVPYSLRRAFKLPTYEDRDAEQAWRFYRLLHAAQSITCAYDQSGKKDGGTSSGEPSRFLLQIQHELAQLPAVRLRRQVLQMDVPVVPPTDISIEKTPDVLRQLAVFLEPQPALEGKPRALSPTELQDLVACPLKFYLGRVAKVAAPEDEPGESMDAKLLGTILHDTLDRLYRPLVGQTVTTAHLDELARQLPSVLAERAQVKMPDLKFGISGRNRLLMDVLLRLAADVIELDRSQAPFELVGIEQRLERILVLPNGQSVLISGKADRIDRVGGHLRLVDYKTGFVASKKLDDLAELFTDPARKEAFQASLYAWLLDTDGSALARQQLQVMLYVMKEIRQGPKDVFGKLPLGPDWSAWEAYLVALLAGLFDPAVPLVQKKDPEGVCRYCDFRRNCFHAEAIAATAPQPAMEG